MERLSIIINAVLWDDEGDYDSDLWIIGIMRRNWMLFGISFEFDVRIVRFGGKSGPSFRQQLTIVSQTDVLVGVHGAGIVSIGLILGNQ